MTWAKHWLLLLGSVAQVGMTAAQPASGGAPPASSAAAAGEPDAELIEFLGADDHADGAWEDMLKRSSSTTPAPAPPARPPPAAPPASQPPPSTSSESGR